MLDNHFFPKEIKFAANLVTKSDHLRFSWQGRLELPEEVITGWEVTLMHFILNGITFLTALESNCDRIVFCIYFGN